MRGKRQLWLLPPIFFAGILIARGQDDPWSEAFRGGTEISAASAVPGTTLASYDRSRAWRMSCSPEEAMRMVQARGLRLVYKARLKPNVGLSTPRVTTYVDFYDDRMETAVRVAADGKATDETGCVVLVMERMDLAGVWERFKARMRR